MKRIASTTAMSLCLAILGAPVVAQEASTGEVLNLGRIIIGYSADGTPVYAGENTSSLEGGAVTGQGGTARIDDVLRQTPGVFTRLDPGNPGVAVAIRGFQGQGRVAASVEGIPQNFRFLGHVSEGYAYVENSFIAGVDVSRGAKVTAGGGGLAGSIDFRLLKPEDLVGTKGWGNIVKLNYGTNGDQFSRMIGTAYVGDGFSMMAAISATDSDEYENADGALVANSGQNTEALMLRGEYKIGDTQSVDLLFTRSGYKFAANSYFQDLTTDAVKLGYSLNAGDQVNLRLNVFWTDYANNYFNSISSGAPSINTGRVLKTVTKGFDLTNVSSFTLGAWDVTSSNGIEYVQDNLSGTNVGVNPSNGSSKRLSFFTENVFEAGAWEITAALRASDYRLFGAYDGGGATPAGVADIDEQTIDPKLTIAYQANDWLQTYASFYKTTRMPSMQETLQDAYHFYGPMMQFYLGPNPLLVPEESKGAEIGFNIERTGLFAPDDRLTARVAYYHMDVENYIAYTDTGEVPFARLYYYDNIPGTTVSKGLELEASYETDAFSAAFSYTNTKSTPPAGSEAYILAPSETFSATVAKDLMSGDLTLGSTLTYTAGGASIDSGVATGSYTLVDIFANYQVTENFNVTAKIANVGDKSYVPFGSSGQGPGRSAYLGAQIRF